MIYFFYLQAPFTHGEDGIQSVPRGRLFGFLDLSQHDRRCTTSCWRSSSPAFLLIYRVIHSPFGQVLKAIRENEPRAISLGYDADRYKLLAFVLSATLSGLAGATKAIVFQLASLTDVHWTMSGEVVLMTLLGGMGTIFGPVVGAFVDHRASRTTSRRSASGSRSSPAPSSSSACWRSAAASSASSAHGGERARRADRRCALRWRRRRSAPRPAAGGRRRRFAVRPAAAATAQPHGAYELREPRRHAARRSAPSTAASAPARSSSGRRRGARIAHIPYDEDAKERHAVACGTPTATARARAAAASSRRPTRRGQRQRRHALVASERARARRVSSTSAGALVERAGVERSRRAADRGRGARASRSATRGGRGVSTRRLERDRRREPAALRRRRRRTNRPMRRRRRVDARSARIEATL